MTYDVLRKLVDLFETAEDCWKQNPESAVLHLKEFAKKYNINDEEASGTIGAYFALMSTKPDYISKQEEEEKYPTINFVNNEETEV